MGQKVHPSGYRVAVIEPWRSRWYATKTDLGRLLIADAFHRRSSNVVGPRVCIRSMRCFQRRPPGSHSRRHRSPVRLTLFRLRRSRCAFRWHCGRVRGLHGRVCLRYHQEDPLDYQMIAQYTPGHVIGHPSIDGGVSLLGQVFPIATSEKCILLKLKTAEFD